MENRRVTKEKMIKVFQSHGMTETDFMEFFEQFGSSGPYSARDIRDFLGY